MNLSLTDSRRLTGANLYWDRPSAIIDVAVQGPAEIVISHWKTVAKKLLSDCDQTGEKTHSRTFDGGASLLISARIDALYTMCELNELAWQCAVKRCEGKPVPDLKAEISNLRQLFAQESRPQLLQLQLAAKKQAAPFLWDDDDVSVGLGKFCKTWSYDAIPDPGGIDWTAVHSIPLALITGTNGKSTTVRMVASIIESAGLIGGLTSTDFIRVGDEVIENGDYSGPGGARQLLRHPRVDMAVLEVARGGLLRRGLGVPHADVALITNVAEDHLGEYGINSLDELIKAKIVVSRALNDDDPLVLNADDAGLLEYGLGLGRKIWWFSMDCNNPLVRENIERGIAACWLEGDDLYSNAGNNEGQGEVRQVVSLSDITSSWNGLLRHNVQNAMGASLVCLALGLPDRAIRGGLKGFRGDESDNPGRGNWFEHRGVRILVDFAHNEHGMEALAATIKAMDAQRVVLMLGQAGDRSDELTRKLTQVACSMKPARFLVCAMPGYERGRELWDVPDLIAKEARVCGIADTSIEKYGSLLSAAKDALSQARSGDVLVLLALTQRQEVLQLVHEFIDG